MLLGALAGGACVLHVHIVVAPAAALGVMVVVGTCSTMASRSDPPWAVPAT
jgi:hypothetical protein